jgi:hypothetical protein
VFLITIDDGSFKRSKHSENDKTGEDPLAFNECPIAALFVSFRNVHSIPG